MTFNEKSCVSGKITQIVEIESCGFLELETNISKAISLHK